MQSKDPTVSEKSAVQNEGTAASGKAIFGGILFSTGAVAVIAAYVLWSLLQTGTFLPYAVAGTPNVINIVVFTTLVAIIFTGLCLVSISLGIRLFFVVRQLNKSLAPVTLGIIGLALFFSAEFLLILHVFRIIPWTVTMLSYAVFWSIVGYGKYKERNRFKKYITESNRAREGKSAIEIRDK